MRNNNMQRAIYREDGAIVVVEVLEDLSDVEFEQYRLKVIETQEKTFYGTSLSVGEIFNVLHNKKYPRQAGCWYLELLKAT